MDSPSLTISPTPAAGPSRDAGEPADLPLVAQGKVRDIYALDEHHLLLVASDRISAYDHVLATPIPDKGRILTQLSAWWFEQIADLVPTHLISANPAGIPQAWQGRAMVVRKLSMISVECVARGYVTGSGLAQVRETGELGGAQVPRECGDGWRLPHPVFTPATKAAVGLHDENISFEQMVAMVGAALANQLRRLTVAVYERGQEVAAQAGLVVADTKLEFGLLEATGADGENPGTVVLGDELLTPDSSRFWLAPEQGTWSPGQSPAQPPVGFDKQYVRDWLTSPASGWDRSSGTPPPPLPDSVVLGTRARYIEAYERLTGQAFH